jgi:hypothetical protein
VFLNSLGLILAGHCCGAESGQSRVEVAGLSRFIVPRPHLRELINAYTNKLKRDLK